MAEVFVYEGTKSPSPPPLPPASPPPVSPPDAPAPHMPLLSSMVALARNDAELWKSSSSRTNLAVDAIDGDTNTVAVGSRTTGNWLSVQLPAASVVGYVAVYFKTDTTQAKLTTFQIWVGASSGETAGETATLCGGDTYSSSQAASEPYVFYCNDAPGEYVTVVQTSTAKEVLKVAELYAY